jgi:hypothetical protein
MSDSIAAKLAGVLAIMARPVPLERAVAGWSAANDEEFPADQTELAQDLRDEGPVSPLRGVLREKLAHWDHLDTAEAEWADGTAPNTEARRVRVYELLKLADDLQAAVVDLMPPHLTDERNVVISREGWNHWYSSDRRAESQFYWSHYGRYLRDVREWDPDNVEALDEATTAIVERLADPRQEENRATRGLVVGHVQSGKTANLTGVIAKAADAGYRLIIVLSGTTDLLRNQTQRRLDKELIGKELIRPAESDPSDEELDYQDDADWDSFIDHGGKPSELGSFDWIRLTGEEWDYRRLKAGIETLEFGRIDTSRPFYVPENLGRAAAKIMVVKKQAQRLTNVIRDLRRITTRLADVPALLIDDESDQASINTAGAREEDRERRTTINRLIVELLGTLPRAQYVGYTATPFASVLVDPDDEEDLFPRDFIVSLRAPRNYMGARDFHDLDGDPLGAEADPYASNRTAFVRDVRGENEKPSNLPRAIDSFVLSGALKLYRAERGVDVSTKHHTMLIHSSRLTADHESDRSLASTLFDAAGFETAEGAARLEALLWEDFAPVSASRAVGLPFPESWGEIGPYVGAAISKIRGGEGPVIVVNGTDQARDPDFDRQGVWKIVVGGAKLSRGYTIEGLTTSYFRRRVNTGDALMQMGRWFGYRENYLDLVRLFISREEQGARGRKYDLYEAFEAVCRDEEAFRSQLQRYSLSEDKDQPPLTPLQVPPLVYSHLPWLPPVAGNKRSNASLDWENWGGRWNEPTMAPNERDRISANATLFRDILASCDLEERTLPIDGRTFDAVVTTMPPTTTIELLAGYSWGASASPVTKVLEFLRGTGDRDPEIDRWVLMAPRLRQRSRVPDWSVRDVPFTVKYRARVSADGSRVKAYTEPLHRLAAEEISLLPPDASSELPDDLRGPRTGVILFYPTHHVSSEEDPPSDLIPTMGFALLFPENQIPQRVVFVARPDDDRPWIPTT